MWWSVCARLGTLRETAKIEFLGSYKCMVNNKFGQDMVTHTLIVNGPPEPPMVILTSQTTDSITFKLKTEDEVKSHQV